MHPIPDLDVRGAAPQPPDPRKPGAATFMLETLHLH